MSGRKSLPGAAVMVTVFLYGQKKSGLPSHTRPQALLASFLIGKSGAVCIMSTKCPQSTCRFRRALFSESNLHQNEEETLFQNRTIQIDIRPGNLWLDTLIERCIQSFGQPAAGQREIYAFPLLPTSSSLNQRHCSNAIWRSSESARLPQGTGMSGIVRHGQRHR